MKDKNTFGCISAYDAQNNLIMNKYFFDTKLAIKAMQDMYKNACQWAFWEEKCSIEQVEFHDLDGYVDRFIDRNGTTYELSTMLKFEDVKA